VRTRANLARLLIAAAAVLGAGASGSESAFYAARRAALMKKMGGGVSVLAGAPDTRAYAPFRQDNDFYYLTGVETPGAFLVLDAGENRTILFLPPRDRHEEQWEGARPAGEDQRMDAVLDPSRLESELQKRVKGAAELFLRRQPEETAAVSRDRAVQHDAAREASPWDGRISREKALESALRRRLGDGVRVADLSLLLDGLRRVKDSMEIERLREASRIAAAGLRAAISGARAGQFEYQLAALAGFLFRWQGAPGDSYFPIVGSGPNSCIVHYHANTRRIEAGDLVVMDYGPDYRYYQADVTRTFPVSESFSDEQRRVYDVVLQAQKAALAQVRPGATFRDLNRAAREVVDRAGLGKYWLHGVSHYIGMSAHDVGDSSPLEPGVALTVEPGVYIANQALGVRIEDTVLVTRDGFENLSGELPREAADIEKLRRAGPPFRLP